MSGDAKFAELQKDPNTKLHKGAHPAAQNTIVINNELKKGNIVLGLEQTKGHDFKTDHNRPLCAAENTCLWNNRFSKCQIMSGPHHKPQQPGECPMISGPPPQQPGPCTPESEGKLQDTMFAMNTYTEKSCIDAVSKKFPKQFADAHKWQNVKPPTKPLTPQDVGINASDKYCTVAANK